MIVLACRGLEELHMAPARARLYLGAPQMFTAPIPLMGQ